ncbi:MAG: kelch-like protein [Chloroflexi bacterium]|nr:kelch-like protein [Chloroflexota bacterium]
MLLLAALAWAAPAWVVPAWAAREVPARRPVAQEDSAERWAQSAPLLEPNSEIAVAELDGRIYAIGGYPSTRRTVNTVQVYDPGRDAWDYAPPLPVPTHHTVAAAVGGTLYVIGGEISPTAFAAQDTFVNTVYALDPAMGEWSPRAPMPTARSAMAVGVIDGRIYVAGGRPPRGNDFAIYDPAADAWTVLPVLPTARNHLAAAAIGGKLYVAGGRFGGGVGSEMTAALEIFDPQTNTWAAAAPLPQPRAGINGIAANGCFFVFGGEGNNAHPQGVFPDVDLYDPAADAWHALAPLPVPVHGVTGAAFLDGWIHLPGGGTTRGGSSGSTIHQVFLVEESCGSRYEADAGRDAEGE